MLGNLSNLLCSPLQLPSDKLSFTLASNQNSYIFPQEIDAFKNFNFLYRKEINVSFEYDQSAEYDDEDGKFNFKDIKILNIQIPGSKFSFSNRYLDLHSETIISHVQQSDIHLNSYQMLIDNKDNPIQFLLSIKKLTIGIRDPEE